MYVSIYGGIDQCSATKREQEHVRWFMLFNIRLKCDTHPLKLHVKLAQLIQKRVFITKEETVDIRCEVINSFQLGKVVQDSLDFVIRE